jgi:hypothetical protein
MQRFLDMVEAALNGGFYQRVSAECSCGEGSYALLQ